MSERIRTQHAATHTWKIPSVKGHGTTADAHRRDNIQERVEMTIRRRKWRWIGHTLRKPPESITRTALDWNPQGTRKRGRPRLSWKRGVRKDLTAANTSWHEVKTIARDRGRWRAFTEALCSRTGEED
ncbi:hypothetical protein Bbelb_024000 [Branchiostoma belcheri]|nr:hypothetical protein Bbelb_024000 [Branchiostoma belcheri]